MEITNISSEDLSSYSLIHDSRPSSDKNNHLNSTIGSLKSRLSNVNSQKPRRLKCLNSIRTASESSTKYVKSFLNLNEKGKPFTKANTKETKKQNLVVSTEKVKLTNRPLIRAGSSSTNSTALRNQSSSKQKEPRHIPNTKNTNKPGSVLSCRGTQTVRGSSKRKAKFVEIEVFMPIIDIENNTITYPKCRKPIIKVHSAKNVAKPRESKRGNSCLNKKNNEGRTKSFAYSKPKGEVNSNKNVSVSSRKREVKNTVKSSLGRNVSSVKDAKLSEATHVVNNKTTYVHRSSIKKANTKVDKVLNTDKSHIETAYATSADFPKKKVVEEFQNLLRDITFDTENVPTLNREEIQELSTSFPSPTFDEYPKTVSRRNSTEKAKNTRVSDDMVQRRCFKNMWRKVNKLPSAISCDSTGDEDVDLCPHATIADHPLSHSDDEYDEYDRKHQSRRRWNLNTRCCQKDPKPRNARKYKQLCSDGISLERKESSFSSPGSLTKIGCNENGWRRMIPKSSFSSECFPMKSKWRRNIKDDELTMECWIERCKYLQSKQQCFQTCSQVNNWRPS